MVGLFNGLFTQMVTLGSSRRIFPLKESLGLEEKKTVSKALAETSDFRENKTKL